MSGNTKVEPAPVRLAAAAEFAINAIPAIIPIAARLYIFMFFIFP
jgi:hypothetical protein